MKHRQHALLLAELTAGMASDHRLGLAGKRVIRNVPSAPQGHPAVTVVVLSYNYGRYLRACVESALSQRDVDLTVVVVDDASSDDTPAVTAELAQRDPRLRVVRNATNRGQLPSMNAALSEVDTEYVIKLDADDILTPGSVARSVALLEAHPEVNLVYGLPEHFNGEVPALADATARSWTLWKGTEWFRRRCRAGTNVILQPEVVMRTAAARAVGPVREYLPHTFDMHLWMQLSLTGDVGRVNGPVQAYYRVHDQSLQHTSHAGFLFDLQGRRAAFDSVFAAEAATLPDAATLHDRARKALAATALDWACRAHDLGRRDEEPVDDLVAFAAETWSGAADLPEWKAWQRRQVGPPRRGTPLALGLYLDAKARRGSEIVDWRRWQHTGER